MPETTVYRILRFSQKHALVILISTFLFTAFMGFFALRVKVRPDLESLIPEDEDITKLIRKYSSETGYSEVMILAVESEDPFRPEALAALAEGIQKISELPHVEPIFTPFNLIGFQSQGKKLEFVRPSVPQTAEEVGDFRRLLRTNPVGKELLLSEDEKILAALFGTLEMDDPRAEMKEFEEIADDLEEYYQVYYSGLAIATYKGILYVRKDLAKLLVITLAFVLLMYYLGFRALRAVFLPIIVVSFGTVWAIGFMGIFGFPITVISIITPPLVLILGTSYSIHVLNQYYRQGSGSTGGRYWIAHAVASVNRTILMASATTVVGFLSLLATTTRQIRQFGLSTSIGIIASAMLSLLFLPAALSFLKPPSTLQSKKIMEGAIAGIMKSLSRFVLRFPVPILLIVVAAVIGFAFSHRHIRHQYDYFAYFPEKEKLVIDTAYTARKLGGFQQLQVTLSAPEGQANYFLDGDILRRVDRFETKLLSYSNVVSSLSFVSYLKHLHAVMTGRESIPETRGLTLLLSRTIRLLSSQGTAENSMIGTLINEDFSRLTISFRVYNLEEDHYVFENELRSLKLSIETDAQAILAPQVNAEIWGNSLRYLSLSKTVNRDQWISISIAAVLIFAITAIFFRSFLYGFCSLFPLITGIMINFITMAVFQIPLDMTTIMVSSIAIGVGVDNSIHLLIQYRKQRKLFPGDSAIALTNTLIITGRPILLTTASIVGGILVLAFASFRPIKYLGALTSITLFATALGSLIVLPAFISLWQLLRRRMSRDAVKA